MSSDAFLPQVTGFQIRDGFPWPASSRCDAGKVSFGLVFIIVNIGDGIFAAPCWSFGDAAQSRGESSKGGRGTASACTA
jgi:hypothetical protein